MKLSDKMYDALKFLAQYVLPGLGALYFALASIWKLPYAEQVVGTITAIDVFLGAILSIGNMQYQQAVKKGVIEFPIEFPSSNEQPSNWLSLNLSKKVYDILYWVSLILLPAGGTLYFALAGLWGFPYGEQIVGTVIAVDAFLGLLLGVSTAKFWKTHKTVTNVY